MRVVRESSRAYRVEWTVCSGVRSGVRPSRRRVGDQVLQKRPQLRRGGSRVGIELAGSGDCVVEAPTNLRDKTPLPSALPCFSRFCHGKMINFISKWL